MHVLRERYAIVQLSDDVMPQGHDWLLVERLDDRPVVAVRESAHGLTVAREVLTALKLLQRGDLRLPEQRSD